jgi:septum formation protein
MNNIRKSQPKIILASSSPQRKEILLKAGFKFDIVQSDYHEPNQPFLNSDELAKSHAFYKAKSVADSLNEGIVIGCDTLVSYREKTIQKPKNKSEAKYFLSLQQGNTIHVISGLSLFNTVISRTITTSVTTEVKFATMTESEIDWYVSTNEWRDKSGGFSIQGLGSRYITSIHGDYQNVVGLPIFKVYEILKSWNFFT